MAECCGVRSGLLHAEGKQNSSWILVWNASPCPVPPCTRPLCYSIYPWSIAQRVKGDGTKLGRVDEAVPPDSPRQQRGAEPEPPWCCLALGKPGPGGQISPSPRDTSAGGETSGRDRKFSEGWINAPSTTVIPAAVI